MKPARLLIAVVLLAGLGGGLWWSNKQEAAKQGQPAADAGPRILKIAPATVNRLEIKHRGDTPVIVASDEHGIWQITSPEKLPADSASVTALADAAGALDSQRVVDANATDLASYGLAPALIEVAITSKDGKMVKLLIGENTPVGGNVYAKVDGDPRLFTLPAKDKAAFDKDIVDFREKHLLNFAQDLLNRIEIVTGTKAIEITRDNKAQDPHWSVVKPLATRADIMRVEDLISKLRTLSLDPNALRRTAIVKPEIAFAAAAPISIIRINDGSSKSLEIRKSKEDYFAKSSTMDGIFKVAKTEVEGLDRPADEYRTKKLMDFGFSDATRIEVNDSGKTTIFDKAGDKWSSAGKPMDATSMQAFIERVRDLTAADFSQAAFKAPAVVTVTVTYNQGRTRETVELAPAGAKFVARHDGGDTALYELTADVVKQLQQSVGDVRPEQTAAKEKKK